MGNIQYILKKYFNGKTTIAEEKALRAYFTRENLPDELRSIAPIFNYLDDEATALSVLKEIKINESRRSKIRQIGIWATAVAACLIMVLTLLKPNLTTSGQSIANGVWINGKLISDLDLAHSFLEESFNRVKTNQGIVDQQLKLFFE